MWKKKPLINKFVSLSGKIDICLKLDKKKKNYLSLIQYEKGVAVSTIWEVA